MQRPIAPQMEPEISVQLLCHMDNLEDMDALSLGMRAVLRWATLETWITKKWLNIKIQEAKETFASPD